MVDVSGIKIVETIIGESVFKMSDGTEIRTILSISGAEVDVETGEVVLMLDPIVRVKSKDATAGAQMEKMQ